MFIVMKNESPRLCCSTAREAQAELIILIQDDIMRKSEKDRTPEDDHFSFGKKVQMTVLASIPFSAPYEQQELNWTWNVDSDRYFIKEVPHK